MNALDPADTIAAVASPPGFGFRGIVRLSGPKALSIALTGFTADAPMASTPGRAERREGRLEVAGLRAELPASVLLWPGSKTYTGGPVAEIHTVGSPPLLQLVLAHTLTLGARAAGPGEFTLRAFLSGRIDLTRAEAVLGVIEASSLGQLASALEQLGGGLAVTIASHRDRLLDVLAHLEANLDFVDEPDVDPLGRRELAASLSKGSHDLAVLADRLKGRDRPQADPRVVLVGPPNAGKSRLFNALLGRAEAIVSPTAGTTRDYVSARCLCDGLLVELVDTAGEEPGFSPIESQAQSLRDEQAARADLLLDCIPAGAPTTRVRPQPTLRVLTKIDLLSESVPPADLLATSAATGEGLAALRSAIARELRSRPAEGDFAASTGARCRDGLTRAGESLVRAAEAITTGSGDELVSVDLRQAIDELGKVIGEEVDDDVLDRIFRRFCIGK